MPGALRKLWSSESLSVTRCMSEQANAERCLSLDRRLGRRSRNGRVRRGVRRHRLYPRPFSHLTTWRPWSVTHGADMSRAGVVLEAARDITVRGESPAHRPSGRPRTSSRARPPGRRPGAGWPERPMARRGQSSPGLVRVGIARNALHRHLLTRHSGRNDRSLSRLCHGQTTSCQPASSLLSAREGVPLAERQTVITGCAGLRTHCLRLGIRYRDDLWRERSV